MKTIIEDQIKYFTCPDCGGLMEITFAGMKNHVDTCKARQPKAVGVGQQVIKPTKFIEMPYECDNCKQQTKIKLPVNEYGEYDIDPPYFCKECDKLDEAL